MGDNRKRLRDNFMHTNGTSPFETVSVILPSIFYTSITVIIVSLLQSFYTKNRSVQFCIEFLTLVTPLLLNLTVLADNTLELLITGFVLYLSLIILLQSTHNVSEEPSKRPSVSSQTYLTNARSLVYILSIIAILAVDFQIFPRRYAKTDSFGYSLMDVGVGLFVYASGIVDEGKTKLLKSLKGVIPLLVLGTARFFATQKIDYHVPVSEYGLHWNFFITLAVTKLFCSMIFTVVNVEFIFINASLLIVSHEVLLQSGLENFVLRDVKRASFVTANREGLVSSIGYISLYLFSVYFGHFLKLRKISTETRSKVLTKLAVTSILCLGLSAILTAKFGISRKLVNSAYCFWILFLGTFMCLLFYLTDHFLKYFCLSKFKEPVFSPLIFEAINYNGLTYFLIANLLTGVINIACDTLNVGSISALSIISLYLLINCAVVCVLYNRKIKLKL